MGSLAEAEVLLVEDEPDDAELLTRALQQMRPGTRVTVVGDGVEALKRLLGDERDAAPVPNLIILDSMGNPVADTIVSVVQGQSDTLTVYVGTARTTYTCEPVCQPMIMLGDDNAFSSTTFASAASSSPFEC